MQTTGDCENLLTIKASLHQPAEEYTFILTNWRLPGGSWQLSACVTEAFGAHFFFAKVCFMPGYVTGVG